MKRAVRLQMFVVCVLVVSLLAACGPTVAPTPAPVATEEMKVIERGFRPTAVPEAGVAAPTQAPTEPVPTAAPRPTMTPPPVPTPKAEPVEFVFAHGGPIRTMDAPVTYYGSTHWLTNLLYDCLIWRKAEGGGYVGQAAEKWEVINPTTWRFYLRPGGTFQNGEPLNAEAVKWNIDRVHTRTDFMVYGQWQFLSEVRVVDEWTIDVITPKPHPYLEFDISYNGCELLPPKYLQEVGEEAFAKKPIGSGPYKLAEFVASERYVFEAWDEYWGGRPEVDRIVYQVIPELASQVAALLAGQIDLIASVPLTQRDQVSKASGITTMTETSGRGFELRLRPDTESGDYRKTFPNYDPTTLDIRIRQAISHALDRNLLAEVHGSAYPKLVRGSRYAPEVATYADKLIGPEVAKTWYDPELAKQLIKEAGYDPDQGKKPKVYFDAADDVNMDKEIAEAIAEMLTAVGFDVELTVWNKAAYNEQIEAPGNNREAKLFFGGTNIELLPKFFHCDWHQHDYYLCNPEWSAVADQIMVEVDQPKRIALWEKWWEYYLEDAHNLGLMELTSFYAMDDKFEWKPRTDGWMTFRDLHVKD